MSIGVSPIRRTCEKPLLFLRGGRLLIEDVARARNGMNIKPTAGLEEPIFGSLRMFRTELTRFQ